MSGKFDAKALCMSRQHFPDVQVCPECERLTKAEEAGYRRGVEEALAQVWCPPTCEDPLCDAQKIRALIRKLGEK